MCWLKVAAAAVSLCQHHCGPPILFGGKMWLCGSQTSPLDSVCACTALLFWFNTTMPPISHTASSPFTFYLYHDASRSPFLPPLFYSLHQAEPTAQWILNQIYCQAMESCLTHRNVAKLTPWSNSSHHLLRLPSLNLCSDMPEVTKCPSTPNW